MWRMNKLIVVLIFVLSVFVQAANQKMVLSAHLATENATRDLYDAEKFFQENTQAKQLKTKYNLTLQLELLESYVLVTIKPIKQVSVKNELKHLFQARFPQYFSVDDSPIRDLKLEKEVTKQEQIPEKPKPIHKENINGKVSTYASLKLFWKKLDSEWIGLLFLALAGFMLVFRSASQIQKIKVLQKEVEKYQSKVEKEMLDMGDSRE